MKSRVKGDFQARFRENVGVKFPCVTRLAVTIEDMKFTLSTFLVLFIFSCKHNQEKEAINNNKIEIVKLKTPENIKTYIHKVDSRDSLCLHEIALAKSQIDSGKLVFTLKTGFGSYNTRQSKHLKELCEKYNLKFGYDEIEDSFNSDYERAGCYGAFMEEAIEKKFGKDFRKKLLREADELIIANNDTVDAYECDIQPEIYGLETNNVIYLSAKGLNVKKNKHGQFISLDMHVYIDKSGKPIGYKLYKYMNDNLDTEREKLLGIAIKELKKYQKCKPGEIMGKKVITENFVTVNFE